jgi:hypothetical protein
MKKLDTKIMNPRNRPGQLKGTELQRNLGVSEDEKNRFVAVDHVIDANKRKRFGEEPKFVD